MDLLEMSFEQIVEEVKKDIKRYKILRLKDEIFNLLKKEEAHKKEELERKSELDLIQKRFMEVV